jgi:hypothetical protein
MNHTGQKKESYAICINASNFFHPHFELVEGRSYIVHDTVVKPSLFGRAEVKLVFQALDGSLVQLSAKRFKRLE